MARSFFTEEADGHFRPTSHCRGPWDPDACHAGPPTGLLARALEHTVPAQRLSRLTVTLQRPIPHAGFRIESSIVRQGRTVSVSEARLCNDEGQLFARAEGLHIATRDMPVPPTHRERFADPEASKKGAFPLEGTRHGLPAFNGDGVEIRYPPGENGKPGPTRLWMRTVPLLDTEIPSPFQRICPLADCGNAIGRNADPMNYSFMNADLTIVLHRDPVGDWLGSESVSYWEPSGIGLADAKLFDSQGVVGRAVQTLVLQAVNPATTDGRPDPEKL